MKIVILGAGISGLAAAWYLKDHEVTVVEKSGRAGGLIRSVDQEGFLFEAGPRGLRPAQQTLELAKELGLDMIEASRQAKKRYICQGGSLKRISLPFLIRHGALCYFKKTEPAQAEDETLETYFTRHFNKRFAKTLIDPLARGIFAGDYRKLSARSCFPNGISKPKKGSLYSFKKGMEELPNALTKQTNVLLNSPMQEVVPNGAGFSIILPKQTLEADVVISTLPYPELPHASIVAVSLGWHQAQKTRKGYGFLVPSTEAEPFWGMTWDSDTFPEQAGQTRVCVMMPPNDDPLGIALAAVEKYTGIKQAPDSHFISLAKEAIPQYYLGHRKWVESLHFPPNFYAIGSSLRGVGVNDCVAAARQVADLLAKA